MALGNGTWHTYPPLLQISWSRDYYIEVSMRNVKNWFHSAFSFKKTLCSTFSIFALESKPLDTNQIVFHIQNIVRMHAGLVFWYYHNYHFSIGY